MSANPPPPRRSGSRADSFRHAFAGWGYVLRTQPNTWIHGIFSIGAVMLSIVLKLRPVEWAAIVLAMGLVWTAELLNTALEAAVDLASPDLHPLARVGKDVAAAAVLTSALVAVATGLLVLGPPLLARVGDLRFWDR